MLKNFSAFIGGVWFGRRTSDSIVGGGQVCPPVILADCEDIMKNLAVLKNIWPAGNAYNGGAKNIAYTIGCYLVALLLMYNGISKVINPWPLIDALKLLANLSEAWLIIISAVVPVIEISLAIMIILKIKLRIVLTTTLILYAAFFMLNIK